MREVYKGIWQREIPLKGNPLKSINIYIVKSQDQAMIVDTGFHSEDVIAHMEAYIRDLDLDLGKTILFLTHLHSDHTGLASYFESKGVPIYMGREEGILCRVQQDEHGPYWKSIEEMVHRQGLEEDQLTYHDHPGFKFRAQGNFEYIPLDIGDYLEVGDFRFRVIDERGHTPGMVGLYEEDKKILFCGDHILGKITPNITYWGEEFGDSLGTYLKNLDRVAAMDIDLLLSSHRHLVEDVGARVETLKAHHDHRLAQAREILAREGEATVRRVTMQLSWDIRARSWSDFPKSQKFFAAGEAQSHLEHLVALGQAQRTQREDGVYLFSLREEGKEILNKSAQSL